MLSHVLENPWRGLMRFLTINKGRPYLECANGSDVDLSTRPDSNWRFTNGHASHNHLIVLVAR